MSRSSVAEASPPPAAEAAMSEADYRNLAAFRRELRSFLAFSRTAVERVGLPPQQYQALLAIKARSHDAPMTVTGLGAELLIRHNSAAELAGRLSAAGLVERFEPPSDGRLVHLRLTTKAEEALQALAVVHRTQLREQARRLLDILSRLAPGAGDGTSPTPPG